MADRENLNFYLIDIRYNGSMNNFYEFYGDNVSYSSVEQDSYLDLKQMVFDFISEDVKFRKHCRDGMVLSLKVEMTDKEQEKFIYLLKNKGFRFIHEYIVSDVKPFKEEEEEKNE